MVRAMGTAKGLEMASATALAREMASATALAMAMELELERPWVAAA
jgi:hypothetical protein